MRPYSEVANAPHRYSVIVPLCLGAQNGQGTRNKSLHPFLGII